jgi:hypothetical protein
MYFDIFNAFRLGILVIGLAPVIGMAAGPAAPVERDIQLAFVTVKSGMDPATKVEYEPALKAACGDLGSAANSEEINAQVVGGWSGDQFVTQVDPNASPRKYGNHLTVETFQGRQRTGRWHLYESGSVWVDLTGSGKNILESCHS